MRTLSLMLVAVLLAASSDSRAAELSPPEALIDRYIEAYNRGDSEALTALYAEDGKIFTADGRRIQGRPAIEKFWRFEQRREGRRLRLMPVEQESSGGIGYVIGNYSLSRPNESGRFTICVKRGEDGAWRIVVSMWNQDWWVGYTPLQ